MLVNVKLSGPMAAGGQVAGQPFAISADNQYAVYVADPAVNGLYDVYSVRADGQGVPIRLSNATIPLGPYIAHAHVCRMSTAVEQG